MSVTDRSARARRWTSVLVVVGLVLLTGAVIGTQTLLNRVRVSDSPSRAELCDQYQVLMATLDDGGAFSTQAGIHAARKLSDQAMRYEQPEREAGDSLADEPPVSQAAGDIRTVMNTVSWEVRDLVTATRPVAVECGWTWPISAAPPAASPRPPSS